MVTTIPQGHVGQAEVIKALAAVRQAAQANDRVAGEEAAKLAREMVEKYILHHLSQVKK